jgi:hypothetical protein
LRANNLVDYAMGERGRLNIGQPDIIGPCVAADRNRVAAAIVRATRGLTKCFRCASGEVLSGSENSKKPFILLARPTRFERVTFAFGGQTPTNSAVHRRRKLVGPVLGRATMDFMKRLEAKRQLSA